MNYGRQLLCTFSSVSCFKIIISEIEENYSVHNNRFFIFVNTIKPDEIFITYNILNENRSASKFPNTISIHRKKNFNILYSLNAMNQIIKDENGGVFDKSFSVNWELYKNSLIITGNPSIRILPITLLEIVNL